MTTSEIPTEVPLSPRLEQFRTEVDQLKVSGGRANPERIGRIVGVVLMVVGLGIGVYAYFGLSHRRPIRCSRATPRWSGCSASASRWWGQGSSWCSPSLATSGTGWSG